MRGREDRAFKFRTQTLTKATQFKPSPPVNQELANTSRIADTPEAPPKLGLSKNLVHFTRPSLRLQMRAPDREVYDKFTSLNSF